jgi:hypothetical protein
MPQSSRVITGFRRRLAPALLAAARFLQSEILDFFAQLADVVRQTPSRRAPGTLRFGHCRRF